MIAKAIETESSARQPASRSTSGTQRVASLDYLKGVLVLLMVVYHAMYAVRGLAPQNALAWIAISLHFLHFAFLFVTGFLCGFHYLPKAQAGERKINGRLLWRGVKLYGIFACSNGLLLLLGLGTDWETLRGLGGTPAAFVSNVVLSIPGKVFAYEILGYIAFYLMVCSLTLSRWSGVIGMLLLAVAVGLINAPFFSFLFVGFVGQTLGAKVALSGAGSIENRLWSLRWLGQLLFVVSRPLVVLAYMSARGLTEVIVVVVDIMLWWWGVATCTSDPNSRLSRQLGVLGRYTLFAYLFQMPIVHILARMVPYVHLHWLTLYVAIIIVTTAITVAVVLAVDFTKHRSRKFRNAFVAIFE